MIYVVNYASNRFLESQRIQNAAWARLPGAHAITVCSFSNQHVLPILRALCLDNEVDICDVLQNPRGDGLWVWKAILTYHVYKNIAQEGDVIFYMDSGACPAVPFDAIWQHIRTHGYFFTRVSVFEAIPKVKAWLESLPSMATKTSLLDDLNFSSRLWTKPFPSAPGNDYGWPSCVLDRLVEAGVSLSETCNELLDAEQICGGFQGYLKRENNDKILKDLLASSSLYFLDDVVRCDSGYPYIDHRHDQALLSLIVNAECVRDPKFTNSIVGSFPQVYLHRGYKSQYPDWWHEERSADPSDAVS